MGKCLLLDGRRQFCEADEYKYHEMLVHFPCAFLGPDRPKQALIIHGGDCGALREVLKYGTDSLERVVVVEEDERITEVCEQHLGARSLRRGDRRVVWMVGTPADEVLSRLVSGPAANNNLQSFDLIVIDGKDRPGGQLSHETAKNIKLLLSPDGVVSCGGGPACTSSSLDGLMPHRLAFSFYSETHDAQTRMSAYARFDLASIDVDGDAHAHRVGMRFFDATDVWSYVPWFLRPKKMGGGAASEASP